MATPPQLHRSTLTPSLLTRTALRLLILACVWVVSATILAPVASADPPVPDTASEAAQRVAQLGRDLEILQEQQNDARVALDTYLADADAARVALVQVNDRLEALDGQIRNVARSAFAGERLGSLSAMLTSGSPQEFLDRVNTLEAISAHNSGVLVQATDAQAAAVDLITSAQAAVTAAQAAVSDIDARQAELQSQITDFQALYAQLTAEEQRVVSGTDESETSSSSSSTSSSTSPSTSSSSSSRGDGEEGGATPPGPVLAPSEAARIAVETAYAQLGDSYSWGAEGPNSFDCSGLTLYAYAAAGVSLPHSSRMQSQMGVPVSRDELQPGDLIFYYSPVSHVAIYVGDGQIIHAYNFGAPVSLASVDVWGAYNSARRIVG